MKMIFSACMAMLMLCRSASAQFIDNFADSDFTANPVWTGSPGSWLVNSALQLQSDNTVANTSFYLTTPSDLADTAQWDFYCNLTFNTSSANYVDVYLVASADDLTQATVSGYFVRIGNTTDEISLYRKDANGTSTKLIDGTDGVLNTSNNVMRIRVVRNAANIWTLFRDLSGAGNSYFTEGSVMDATYNSSAFFGILVKQSTSSFFQRHYFDDISVQHYVPDTVPPVVVSATAVSVNAADVLFNETVDTSSAQTAGNYVVSGTAPLSAIRDSVNGSLVHLIFADNFPPRINETLKINAVRDISGNEMGNASVLFNFYIPYQYDVVIDELMADPDPAIQLPGNEWLELKNITPFAINLQGWVLGKATGESGPMPAFILKPDSFVVVCTSSAVGAMSAYGRVISVTSFPSLDNDGDKIYLRANTGTIIHSVNYTDAWYNNALKQNGGWSLEMIDTHNPCSSSENWKASTDVRGGTPGQKNAVDALNPDEISPRLLRAFAPDSLHIILAFNESLDSSNAALATHYSISDGVGTPVSATPLSVSFDHVSLSLGTPLTQNKIYTVTVTGAADCSGNTVGVSNTARAGLCGHTDSLDIVVNEILFNPKPNGVDYAEFFNRSTKILNLKNAYIANRNTSGAVSSVTQFTSEDYAFFPGDYICLTSDPVSVQRDFYAQNPDAFLTVTTPSFNDDAGSVIVLNEQGSVIDEAAYTEKWHFALVANDEGVSLERIDPDAPTVQSNFHSAATSAGYGTPTYKNSQYRSDGEAGGTITVTPKIISPDNDGRDDFATLNYEFPEPGYVANITVFDAAGRLVRYLQRSALCGKKGYYRWDGLGDNNQKLPAGLYIIYTQIFNLQGKTKQFKNTIVVAGQKR